MKHEHHGGGNTAQKIIAGVVISVFVLMLLSQPGTDKAISGWLQMAINNLILGIQPLVHLAAELVGLALIGYLVWLFIRRKRS